VTARLLSLGTAVPRFSLAQSGVLDMIRAIRPDGTPHDRATDLLFARSRIDHRSMTILDEDPDSGVMSQSMFPRATSNAPHGPGVASRMERYERDAPPLAARAARDALHRANVTPGDITHVITASCTGFVAPGVDQHLCNDLGLRRDVHRLHLGFMGCHAALNACTAADAIARADVNARVLVCCVELCTLHLHYRDDVDAQVANALFADGAAAAIIAIASEHDALFDLIATGTHRIDDTADDMRWTIGDHGFNMHLSPDVPQRIRAGVGDWIGEWLHGAGVKRGMIDHWAIHPGGPKILTAARDGLGLDDDALTPSTEVLRAHGNMSSPTTLFILERILECARPGAWCVAIAFGPGLVMEACLLRRSTRDAH